MSGLCQCTSFDHQFSSLDRRLSLECRHKTVLVGNLFWSESSLFILRCRTSSHHRWEQHKGLIPRSHFQNWWQWSSGEAQLVQGCPTDIRESLPCCQACWVLPPGSPLTAATATIPPQDTGFPVPWPKPFLEWLGQVLSPSRILWSLTAEPGWSGGTARDPAWTIKFSRISVWHLAWSSCCWCSSTYSWYMAGSSTIICASTFNPLLLTSLLIQATKYSSWI